MTVIRQSSRKIASVIFSKPEPIDPSGSYCCTAVRCSDGQRLAFAGVRLSVAVAPANLPRLDEIHVGWPVLLFAFGLSLLTAITFGVFPSLRSLRADPQLVLQSGSPRMSGARKATATRRLLVAFEVACTVVLLILTSLVSRSFSRVLNQDRSFRSDHLIVGEVNLLRY